MLEVIFLYFLTRYNGVLAQKKGLKPGTWKMYTVVSWIVAELIGIEVGLSTFGKTNLLEIVGMGLFFAFGGYLLVKYILENKPDYIDDDMNKVGVDELGPPKP
jgi:hypothetical protein